MLRKDSNNYQAEDEESDDDQEAGQPSLVAKARWSSSKFGQLVDDDNDDDNAEFSERESKQSETWSRSLIELLGLSAASSAKCQEERIERSLASSGAQMLSVSSPALPRPASLRSAGATLRQRQPTRLSRARYRSRPPRRHAAAAKEEARARATKFDVDGTESAALRQVDAAGSIDAGQLRQQTIGTHCSVDVSRLSSAGGCRTTQAGGVASALFGLGGRQPVGQGGAMASSARQPAAVDMASLHERPPARYLRAALGALGQSQAGSYKVAQQQQQVSVSASGGAAAVAVDTRRRPARHIGRPGRSPLSLQRQTNARLTRHQLRIQQQRQEQLVQLALREREQLLQVSGQQKHIQGRRYATDEQEPRALNQLASPTQEANLAASAVVQVTCDSSQLVAGSSRLQASSPADASSRPGRAISVVVFKSANMVEPGNQRAQLCAHRLEAQTVQHKSELDDAQTINSASSTLSLNRPFCKICHLGACKDADRLISPCKCSGTMQYIHCGCLLKWLEISNRSNERPISCELCAHEYTWHKRFNYANLRFPRCSPKDIFLHVVFILALGMMLASASAPMLWQRPAGLGDLGEPTSSSRPARPLSNSLSASGNFRPSSLSAGGHPEAGRLAHEERFMLLCAASFFISFFMAIYVQTKTRDTLYSLASKFLSINQTYYITEYDHGQSAKQQQVSNPAEDLAPSSTHRFGAKSSNLFKS